MEFSSWSLFFIWVFFLFGFFEFFRKILFEYKFLQTKKIKERDSLVIISSQEENIESILRILHHHGIEAEVVTPSTSYSVEEIIDRLSMDLDIAKHGDCQGIKEICHHKVKEDQ